MTSLSVVSHATIHLWFERPDPNSARSYCHAALEVDNGINSSYMSFWEDVATDRHRQVCPNVHGAHFHLIPKIDHILLSSLGKSHKKYVLHSLNIEKIERAFEKFKKNPLAWGALGWGIWGRSYKRNSSGIVAYLLEKGGVFNHLNYTRTNSFKNIFQLTAFLSAISAIANLFSYFQLQYYEKDFSKYYSEVGFYLIYIFPYGKTISHLNRIKLEASKIGKEKSLFLDSAEIEKEVKNINEIFHCAKDRRMSHLFKEAKEANTTLKRKSVLFSDDEKIILDDSMRELNRTLISIVTGSSIIFFMSLGLFYLNNQILLGRHDARSVAIMAKRVQKLEKRDERLFRIASNSSNSRYLDFYYKKMIKKTNIFLQIFWFAQNSRRLNENE